MTESDLILKNKVEQLQKLREQARKGGGDARIEAQHK
jgi:hypothetical protein